MKAFVEFLFWISLCAVIVGIPAFVIWNTIATDGQVTACYIREHTNLNKDDKFKFALMGDINWRQDSLIGWFDSQDTARAEAAKLNCPITP